MKTFEECAAINDLLRDRKDSLARNQLIRLLDYLKKNEAPYPQVLNHLIRQVGLYPYISDEVTSWQEKFVLEAFAVDVGRGRATLHREQSLVLSKLLKGEHIAVSAPTSFGKSFIIDAFIAAKSPGNVVIIVPTIALMDETRRRIYQKFGQIYNIITSADAELGTKNILIFPQERAFSYLSKLNKIDLLVVDEFYKVSKLHDKERSPSLAKAILKLSRKSKQRYYLTPNVRILQENVFTQGMQFIDLVDYNTVVLEQYDLYKEIQDNSEKKRDELVRLISRESAKTLIYAGTYKEIDRVSDAALTALAPLDRPLLNAFSTWLRQNYLINWRLADLVDRGVGVHNGRMHRSLSQIQVRLFDEKIGGLNSIISTSSIIEGVNTVAENVIIWKNRNGNSKLTDFTFKNIIGRSGRMFQHFIGKVYLLDVPPADEDSQLKIDFPETILGDLDALEDEAFLTAKQIEKIIEYKTEMANIIGEEQLNRLIKESLIQDSDSDFILRLAKNMRENPEIWAGFSYLNSSDPKNWNTILYKIIELKPAEWQERYSKLVEFTNLLANNWVLDMPEMLILCEKFGINVEDFFKLEKLITYKLSALLNDVNELHKIIVDPKVDVSPLVTKMGKAFLPGTVYQLEEYGLPRMISKKINKARIIDLTDPHVQLQNILAQFRDVGKEAVRSIATLSTFDKYIIDYFYEGISQAPQ